MILVTIFNPRTFHRKIFLSAKTRRGVKREGQKWQLLRILKILRTKTWLWRFSKGLRIRRHKAFLWVTIFNWRTLHLKICPRAINTRGVKKEGQTWQRLGILKVLSTKTWLWHISNSLRISTEIDIVNVSFCNLCALAVGLALYLGYTVLTSFNKSDTDAILLYRFLSCWCLETFFT